MCVWGTPPPRTAAGRDSELDAGTRRRQGLGNAAAGTAPSDTEAVGKWDFSSDPNQFSIPLNEPSDTTGEGWCVVHGAGASCVFSRSAHVPLPTPRPPSLRRQQGGLCGNCPLHGGGRVPCSFNAKPPHSLGLLPGPLSWAMGTGEPYVGRLPPWGCSLMEQEEAKHARAAG